MLLREAPDRAAPSGNRHTFDASLRIEGGLALIGGEFVEAAVDVSGESGTIIAGGADAGPRRRLDAGGLLVLPGIVDMHGDAFERQIMPRPNVDFALDMALLESDRQAIANGITTIFHGVTCSWEPGLRGTANAHAILRAIEALRPRLAADTRFHLRHETFNLDAEEEISAWLAARRIHALAFNDHMTSIADGGRPKKLAEMAERAAVSAEEFAHVVMHTKARAGEVPASIARLAAAAQTAGVPLLSHDDTSPEQRRWYRSLGCRIAEFPTTLETAQAAAADGDVIVLGAPNVVRGKSHTGWTNAAEMIAKGLCSILASDYYYPAPLLAAFRLEEKAIVPLPQAWRLIAETPAMALGLSDRGRIEAGLRGDLILVDKQQGAMPNVVATITAGRLALLTDATRMSMR